MLYVVGREVRANDVTAVVPHGDDIREERFPDSLTASGVRDVVLGMLM